MSVSVWEREKTWVIDKNSVAKSHITVKIITKSNRPKSAHNPVSRETPYLTRILPGSIAPDPANRRPRLF